MVAQAGVSAGRLREALDPAIRRAVEATDADRYRKRFPAYAHIWMLVLHALSGNASLRQSYQEQSSDGRLRERLGMPEWISFSQLARSSSSRPGGCFESILGELVSRAKGTPLADPAYRLLDKVQLLDSTFLSLSAKLSPWGAHKGYAPGMRLQVGLELARLIPTQLRLTLTEISDRTALKEWDLSALAGWTLVFDLGYYAHPHFERLLGADVSFITRLQAQAYYRVVSGSPVPEARTAEGDTILSDETVTLGSPNNRTGAVLPDVRLVAYKTSKGERYKLITDRHDLTALEVVTLYRKRWQIELFFRWLKRALGALHLLGRSRAAVWLTILVAAIVAVLMYLLDALRPRGVTRVSWLRALRQALVPHLQPSG